MKANLKRNEDEHRDEIIDNETLERYVQREEPKSGPLQDYENRSEEEKLMGDIIKKAVKLSTKRIINRITEGVVEELVIGGYD